MSIQPITRGGRVVAAATAHRFFLADDLDERTAGDPEKTFVIFMCVYASDILNGRLTGPYRDQDAEDFVRAALHPHAHGEIEQDPYDIEHIATVLGIPADELRAHRRLRAALDAACSARPRRRPPA